MTTVSAPVRDIAVAAQTRESSFFHQARELTVLGYFSSEIVGKTVLHYDPIPGRFDDRQCTSCHASKAQQPAKHTHHLAGSVGSRCTSCHMPYIQEPETTDPRTGRALVRYARSDHSIAIPRPHADSALGVMTACASCHPNRTTKQLLARMIDANLQHSGSDAKPLTFEVLDPSSLSTNTISPNRLSIVFFGLAAGFTSQF